MTTELDLGRLAAFAAAAILLIGLPGPNNIYISTRAVSQGRTAGVVSALGIGTGTVLHATVAAVGLSALVAASPVALQVVRYAGAAYLTYLGIRTLTARRGDAATTEQRRGPLRRAYLDGVLVNVLNPKVALFFLGFLPQVLTPDAPAATVRAEVFAFGALAITLGLFCDVGYALAADLVGTRLRRRNGELPGQRYVVAAVYLSLAVAAVVVH